MTTRPSAAAIVAETVKWLVLAELGPDDQAALASVDAVALFNFAWRCSPTTVRRAELFVRDRALVELHVEYDCSAAEIAAEWAEYAGNGWLRDCDEDHCPNHLEGSPKRFLWLAMKVYGQPLTRQRIVQVIEK